MKKPGAWWGAMAGLEAVSFLNGFGRDWIDNVRIYTAAP